MTIIKTAAKGASWLALFRAFSQIISWGTTIIVTRLLVPADYGLMLMATIFTGFAALVSEMGLGAAIVQREKISIDELSSLFWFLLFWAIALTLVCIGLSYPTAGWFNEPKTIPVTQASGIVYFAAIISIVPRYILLREFKFKLIGFVDTLAIIISCLAMIFMAHAGAAVWTLIGGHIIRELVKTFLLFTLSSWRPRIHYKFSEIKSYLSFGLNVSLGNCFDYTSNKLDGFFGGRILGDSITGYYGLALQVAQVPNEKIVSLINNVAYPVLARFQTEPEKSRIFFLRLVEAIALLTFPIFIGTAVIAEELVLTVFGSKWQPMVIPLQLLCFAQFFVAITTPISIANVAQGRPHWPLRMNLLTVIALLPSFYYSAQYGLNTLALPWITIFPLLRLFYAYLTLRKMQLSFSSYFSVLSTPIIAGFIMAVFVETYMIFSTLRSTHPILDLIIEAIVGTFGYTAYLFFIRKRIITTFKEVWKF